MNWLLDILTSLLFIPIGMLSLAFGAWLCVGGIESVRRFCLPVSRRHRTFFNGLALITITVAGGFFAVASSILVWNSLVSIWQAFV